MVDQPTEKMSVFEPKGPGEPTPPGGIPRKLGGEDDLLDVARGEVSDDDLAQLEAAVDAIDFATRKASPERLERLKALVSRQQDLIDQITKGVRTPKAERQPVTPEQQARFQQLVDEGVAAGERGDLPAARKALEEAVRLAPEAIEGLFNLGVVYGLIAHREISKAEFYDSYSRDEILVGKAKNCYDRVLELEPKHLPSLKNLATLYTIRQEPDVAKEYLKRLLEVAPQTDDDKAILEEARQQLAELDSI